MAASTCMSNNDTRQTSNKQVMKSVIRAANNDDCAEDVHDQIDDMLKNVPLLEKTFSITNKIGSGTFSSVYVANLKSHPNIKEEFALKHIIPTSHPSRIESELKCLQQLGGADNVMGVQACIRDKDHVVIVMPYFQHDKFTDYVRDMSVCEMQEYMRNLLLALRRVHKLDIIHRDIKPSNFLVNRKMKRYALVDFGLAQKAPVPLYEANKSLGNKIGETTSGSSSDKENCKQNESAQSGKSENSRSSLGSSSHDKNSDIPLSLSQKLNRTQLQSPCLRKRKLSLKDDNDQSQSPRKKQQLERSLDKELSHVSLSPVKQRVSSGNKPSTALLAPTKHTQDLFQTSTSKSPRRMLLTRRAIDMSKKPFPRTMSHDSIKLGTNTKRNSTGGAPGSCPTRPGMAQQKTIIVGGSGGKTMYKTMRNISSVCHCYQQPSVCSFCLARTGQTAPRAGTPGFRAPEVLMKYPDQTTAVDIWSAGVIMLCMMSGRYPFFKAGDDLTALAQIISIMGSENTKMAAKSLGKDLMCNPISPPINLRSLCLRLRNIKPVTMSQANALPKRKQDWANVPTSAFILLKRLLDLNPSTRITAEEALQHPFFQEKT